MGELVPRPRTELGGPVMEYDFPAFRVGVAEYDEGPTGCTVFHFPTPALAVADARGGAVGAVLTDQLRTTHGEVSAICFAGGSLYGLEAVTGLTAALRPPGLSPTDWWAIPSVTGCVIYDFPGRGEKGDHSIYPDAALSRAALAAAQPNFFPVGPRGAGRAATVGKCFKPMLRQESAGQGGAFRQIGQVKIAFFCVVNALGAIIDKDGQVVRGNLAPDGRRVSPAEALKLKLKTAPAPRTSVTGNTVPSLLVTNVALEPIELRRLAIQVHASMARWIQPFHTQDDGDVLYAVTTGEVRKTAMRRMTLTDLGVLAGEGAWEAVVRV